MASRYYTRVLQSTFIMFFLFCTLCSLTDFLYGNNVIFDMQYEYALSV